MALILVSAVHLAATDTARVGLTEQEKERHGVWWKIAPPIARKWKDEKRQKERSSDNISLITC